MGSSRTFSRKLDSGREVNDPAEKLALLCLMHFGIQDPKTISCESCLDFKQHHCPGEGLKGDGCIQCMALQADSGVLTVDF